MNEFTPKVSIVIPVYNGSNFLREAIDSSFAQTYPNIEVIVVNDGSIDDGKTREIALSYGERLRYFEKENGGVSSALNLGIREMTGEYFCWLSHDDVYYPDKVAVQVDYLQRSGRDVIYYSDFVFIDAVGKLVGTKRVTPVAPDRFRYQLIVGDPVNGCTVMVPKHCFVAGGMFDEKLWSIQDYDLWFRLAKDYPFVHIPKPLVQSRQHPAQGSLTLKGHLAECDAAYCGFIRELTLDEIKCVTAGHISLFYLWLAIRVKLRGFLGAAEVAHTLSRCTRGNEPFGGIIKLMGLEFFYAMLTKKMKPAYWVQLLKGQR